MVAQKLQQLSILFFAKDRKETLRRRRRNNGAIGFAQYVAGGSFSPFYTSQDTSYA